MKKSFIALGVAVLTLVGCANQPASTQSINTNTSTTNVIQNNQINHYPQTKRFLCDIGITPVIHVINDSQIVLEINNTRTTLNIARSGSGSLYQTSSGIFGYGGEWHQSGNEAYFAYKNVHGVPGRTKCSIEL